MDRFNRYLSSIGGEIKSKCDLHPSIQHDVNNPLPCSCGKSSQYLVSCGCVEFFVCTDCQKENSLWLDKLFNHTDFFCLTFEEVKKIDMLRKPVFFPIPKSEIKSS